MNCSKFREISEDYLSKELSVEANISFIEHLENCPNCNLELTAQSEMRVKVKSAVLNADEFKINPFFARRLNQNLRAATLEEKNLRNSWFTPKFLLPAMALLLLAITLGFFLLNFNEQKNEPIATQIETINETPKQNLTEISLSAVGNHKHCALKKLQRWEELAKKEYAEKDAYNKKVAKPLKANFSKDVEMLHAHECVFEGKKFNHVILKKGKQIASVFVDKSTEQPENGSSEIKNIINEKNNDFKIAAFLKNTRAVFFISDFSEAENIKAAQTIRDLSEL